MVSVSAVMRLVQMMYVVIVGRCHKREDQWPGLSLSQSVSQRHKLYQSPIPDVSFGVSFEFAWRFRENIQ